jgi:UDP-N-acetylmuramoyl-tripeptide--D-alanyl-D-alanine ligase
LKPELLVVTAVSPEHMVFFKSLDVVAREELLPVTFSEQALLNVDDIPKKYLPGMPYLSYGLKDADFKLLKQVPRALKDQDLQIELKDKTALQTEVKLLGEQGAKSVLAAAAVGNILGMSNDPLSKSLAKVEAFPGRMQILKGINDSTLIDDTYNASPVAILAALDVLYASEAPQRIAILGSMNEMGDAAPAMHQEVGDYCNPTKLDLIITVGKDAQDYLAPVAKAKGCKVQSFLSPIEAGEYAKAQLKPGAVILAKGSETGVFTEEALKILLADPSDGAKLVRQSPQWQQKKRQFS